VGEERGKKCFPVGRDQGITIRRCQMYILGINGSPHKRGSTAYLLKVVLEAAKEEGLKTRLLHVSDVMGGQKRPYCIACSSPCNETCHRQSAKLKEACLLLEGASGLVLGSPVYFGTVSGQLKSFWDKTRAIRSRRSLVGKPAGAVSVGASRFGGQETTIRTLHDMMLIHGMSLVGEGTVDFDAGHQGVCAQRPAEEDQFAIERARILGKRLAQEVKKRAE
jgi:multimeric flavodoxin WrbA